jgi:hypothetical protein
MFRALSLCKRSTLGVMYPPVSVPSLSELTRGSVEETLKHLYPNTMADQELASTAIYTGPALFSLLQQLN